jgi:hypothetical protein
MCHGGAQHRHWHWQLDRPSSSGESAPDNRAKSKPRNDVNANAGEYRNRCRSLPRNPTGSTFLREKDRSDPNCRNGEEEGGSIKRPTKWLAGLGRKPDGKKTDERHPPPPQRPINTTGKDTLEKPCLLAELPAFLFAPGFFVAIHFSSADQYIRTN